MARITSYNVCYTKLLRIPTPHGFFEILENHGSGIFSLQAGICSYTDTQEETISFYISDGMAEIEDGNIKILVTECFSKDDLHLDDVASDFKKVSARLNEVMNSTKILTT